MPKEIVVPMENKPGGLAKVAEVFGAAGVNVEGVGYATGPRGVLRVVTDDAAKAQAALKAAKIKVKEVNDAISVTLPNTPGTLARMARKLADKRVNIEAFYIVGAGPRGLNCVLTVDKPEKAKALLKG
jgi:hypothetical protein